MFLIPSLRELYAPLNPIAQLDDASDHMLHMSTMAGVLLHIPVGVKSVRMLLWVVQSQLLVHRHLLLISRDVPAKAVLLNPLNHAIEPAGHTLKGLGRSPNQQQELNLETAATPST
jgi:hypothetical protein